MTSGPYRYLRHPIYTGELLAVAGSALVGGVVWIVVFIALASLVLYRVIKEERMLAAEFPEEYPAYKKRTPALVPFLF